MGIFSDYLNRPGHARALAGLCARRGVSGKISGLPKGGSGKVLDVAQRQGRTDLDDFLYFGVWWADFSSSNVAMARYLEDTQTLLIGFHNGAIYGYEPVSTWMAKSFWTAASKGTWVWDHLRKRGTRYGHHVDYYYDQGRSAHIPLYRLDRSLEIIHDREALEQGGKYRGFFIGRVPGEVGLGEIILPRE
jgi:hypothetical protein